MSLLLPDSGLLFWMVLSFAIVFGILAKFGFPVIVKMVEKRKAFIDSSLSAAKEAQQQLAKVKESCEALIAEADREHGKIVREATAERDKIIAEAQSQAKIAAEKEIENVRALIRQEQDKAISEIRCQIAALSVEIAEKVIDKKLEIDGEQMELIGKMIDKALKEEKTL